MAPRAVSAFPKKNKSRPEGQIPPRRSLRLQALTTPLIPIAQSACKQKRLYGSSEADVDEPGGVLPSKQSQILCPSKGPPLRPSHELTEKNLRVLNGEDMESAANNGRSGGTRRFWSPEVTNGSPEVTPEETPRTKSSSIATANYRYNNLEAAKVFIHTDPPIDVQTAINRIVEAEISGDRNKMLRDIAKQYHISLKEIVKSTVQENEFINLLHQILNAMGPRSIQFIATANWRVDLKPLGSNKHQETNDASALPLPKRQRLLDFTLGNIWSQPNGEIPPIKTPRPDISIGIKASAFISALTSTLSSQNFNGNKTEEFLKHLQHTLMPSEKGRPAEPVLVMMPTQDTTQLLFPFFVVEGKAYSTGRQAFEAQNQAAVAGACGLKIQLSLNKLVEYAGSNDPPIPFVDQLPLFFSICTEGPYHELWAHYTYVEDDVRKFNMTLLKICNGMLLNGMEDFVVAVDNVLRWGTGKFQDSVVERLRRVAVELW